MYHQIAGRNGKRPSRVVHNDMFDDCHYFRRVHHDDTRILLHERKPRGCTVCDECQRLQKLKHSKKAK